MKTAQRRLMRGRERRGGAEQQRQKQYSQKQKGDREEKAGGKRSGLWWLVFFVLVACVGGFLLWRSEGCVEWRNRLEWPIKERSLTAPSQSNKAAEEAEEAERKRQAEEGKKKKSAGGRRKVFSVGKAEIAMRWIPAGTFRMGAGAEDKEAWEREKPQHQVTITRGYWMGETEVTQGQYLAVVGVDNPSGFKGANRPVERVSWYDAAAFANKLSALNDLPACFVGSGEQMRGIRGYVRCKGWRLPTEAEWEYAARAGTTTPRYGELDKIAWYRENSGMETHAVGKKDANAWGLKDMLGNVWEWCYDWHGGYTEQAATDPVGAATGSYRVNRGGGWYNFARWARAAVCYGDAPANRSYDLGFRLVRLSP